jgi:hypothetical protein
MGSMPLPLFTAEVSLHAGSEDYSYSSKMKEIDRSTIRPQENSCEEDCQVECCLCPHDSEGPIEGSCFCRQGCLSNCYRRCNM